jgi:CheY-like chemotaxis protein
MLEKLGVTVDVAHDGSEALEAVAGQTYRLVFMDCHMPVMDGYQTTREIRRREGDERHTPVVALTANATEAERERCFACGMDDYLSKPLRLPALTDVLEKWLASTGTRPPQHVSGNEDIAAG